MFTGCRSAATPVDGHAVAIRLHPHARVTALLHCPSGAICFSQQCSVPFAAACDTHLAASGQGIVAAPTHTVTAAILAA